MAEHDYRQRCWGHDYTFTPQDGGQRGQLSGWGEGIQQGDYLLLQHPESADGTRYQVETIRYYPDPPDMWRATARFAPRQRED